MIQFFQSNLYRACSVVVLLAFVSTSVVPPSYAQMVKMPEPGTMVGLTPAFTPAHLMGMTIDPKNALKFDFLMHKGDDLLTDAERKAEYTNLIKYFLASLTVPTDDQWVNLSPYEGNRIIKDNFGLTEMGRDLLAQDYMLKQLTASLMHPDTELGKQFWAQVYEKAYQQYGTTDVPVDTFNKIWITADNVSIFEKDNTALIVDHHLKVMTERDYVATDKNALSREVQGPAMTESAKISAEIVKEIIIPAIEKEVNEGKTFANLRQIYSGMILATWFKKQLRESILGKAYADRSKTKGVDQDPKNNEEIYKQYLAAFKKGVFNMIKEDVDRYTNEAIPRKYFSGGTKPVTKYEKAPEAAARKTIEDSAAALVAVKGAYAVPRWEEDMRAIKANRDRRASNPQGRLELAASDLKDAEERQSAAWRHLSDAQFYYENDREGVTLATVRGAERSLRDAHSTLRRAQREHNQAKKALATRDPAAKVAALQTAIQEVAALKGIYGSANYAFPQALNEEKVGQLSLEAIVDLLKAEVATHNDSIKALENELKTPLTQRTDEFGKETVAGGVSARTRADLEQSKSLLAEVQGSLDRIQTAQTDSSQIVKISKTGITTQFPGVRALSPESVKALEVAAKDIAAKFNASLLRTDVPSPGLAVSIKYSELVEALPDGDVKTFLREHHLDLIFGEQVVDGAKVYQIPVGNIDNAWIFRRVLLTVRSVEQQKISFQELAARFVSDNRRADRLAEEARFMKVPLREREDEFLNDKETKARIFARAGGSLLREHLTRWVGRNFYNSYQFESGVADQMAAFLEIRTDGMSLNGNGDSVTVQIQTKKTDAAGSTDASMGSVVWKPVMLTSLAAMFALQGVNTVRSMLQPDLNVPAIQAEGQGGVSAITRIISRFLKVYRAIIAAERHGAEVMNAFEKGAGNKELALSIAEDIHTSWLALERRGSKYVEYSSEIQDFMLRMIDAKVITVDNGKQVVTRETFLDPWKKFKFGGAVFNWEALKTQDELKSLKDIKDAQEELTRLVNGKTNYIINTIAIEAAKSVDLYRPYGEDKAKRRAERIYDLQRASEGGVLASLFESPELLDALATGTKDQQISAIVAILGNINVFWRVNNPWNTINDLLMHKRFGLANKPAGMSEQEWKDVGAGIGARDIYKDLVALKAILQKLSRSRDSMTMAPQIKAQISQAFDRQDNGLQALLDELAPEQIDSQKLDAEDASLPIVQAIIANPGKGTPDGVLKMLSGGLDENFNSTWSFDAMDVPLRFGDIFIPTYKAVAFLFKPAEEGKSREVRENWKISTDGLSFVSDVDQERGVAGKMLETIQKDYPGASVDKTSANGIVLRGVDGNAALKNLTDGLKSGKFDAASTTDTARVKVGEIFARMGSLTSDLKNNTSLRARLGSIYLPYSSYASTGLIADYLKKGAPAGEWKTLQGGNIGGIIRAGYMALYSLYRYKTAKRMLKDAERAYSEINAYQEAAASVGMRVPSELKDARDLIERLFAFWTAGKAFRDNTAFNNMTDAFASLTLKMQKTYLKTDPNWKQRLARLARRVAANLKFEVLLHEKFFGSEGSPADWNSILAPKVNEFLKSEGVPEDYWDVYSELLVQPTVLTEDQVSRRPANMRPLDSREQLYQITVKVRGDAAALTLGEAKAMVAPLDGKIEGSTFTPNERVLFQAAASLNDLRQLTKMHTERLQQVYGTDKSKWPPFLTAADRINRDLFTKIIADEIRSRDAKNLPDPEQAKLNMWGDIYSELNALEKIYQSTNYPFPKRLREENENLIDEPPEAIVDLLLAEVTIRDGSVKAAVLASLGRIQTAISNVDRAAVADMKDAVLKALEQLPEVPAIHQRDVSATGELLAEFRRIRPRSPEAFRAWVQGTLYDKINALSGNVVVQDRDLNGKLSAAQTKVLAAIKKIIDAAGATGHLYDSRTANASQVVTKYGTVDVTYERPGYYNDGDGKVSIVFAGETKNIMARNVYLNDGDNELAKIQALVQATIEKAASLEEAKLALTELAAKNIEEVRKVAASSYGGIDFNEQYLKMNIKRDGNGVPLPIGQQDLDNIKIDGLVPVILNITPVTSLPVLN